MKNKYNLILFFFLLPVFLIIGCSGDKSNILKGRKNSKLPHLRIEGSTTQLILDGEPFLMLGGELHNSSTAGLSYMRPIWKQMVKANLNTVIGTASWELVEPVEEHYDFEHVDSMIMGARKEGLKLVVIWFASWKNGESTYTPSWVKKDTVRFPLVKDENGNKLNIITPFCEEGAKADAQAFAALMKHIRKIDSKQQTVIMVQVENEIGTLRTRRDFSNIANTSFNSPVPAKLLDYLEQNKATIHRGVAGAWEKEGFRKEGTWEEVFGKGVLLDDWKDLSYLTEELFMAWNYAKYVEQVAKAGKEEYNLPMYVNAWLKQPGRYGHAPGNYPSGGPTPQVIDIWRAAAPSIDFIAPDIYITDEFRYICDQYTMSGNPLFIPETTCDAASASRAFYTFGKYHAMGYAPFGIDGDDGGADITRLEDIKDTYSTLYQLIPIINKYAGTENMSGLIVDNNRKNDTVVLGDYMITGTLGRRYGGAELAGVNIFGTDVQRQKKMDEAGGAIIICTKPGEYLISGRNMSINFLPPNLQDSSHVSFLMLEEGSFANEEWNPGRRLNGDEFRITLPAEKSKIYKASLYSY